MTQKLKQMGKTHNSTEVVKESVNCFNKQNLKPDD